MEGLFSDLPFNDDIEGWDKVVVADKSEGVEHVEQADHVQNNRPTCSLVLCEGVLQQELFSSPGKRERTHRWEHWIGSEVRLIGHIALALAVVGVPAGPVLKKAAVTRKLVRLRLKSGKPPFINCTKCGTSRNAKVDFGKITITKQQ